MIRGAVYRVDLGAARGHEQRGRRLGVVLSPTDSALNIATIVPTSTSAQASRQRPEMEIAGRPTRLLVDQIRSIDTDYILGEPVDFLSRFDLALLEEAVIRYLGFDLSGLYDPRTR